MRIPKCVLIKRYVTGQIRKKIPWVRLKDYVCNVRDVEPETDETIISPKRFQQLSRPNTNVVDRKWILENCTQTNNTRVRVLFDNWNYFYSEKTTNRMY